MTTRVLSSDDVPSWATSEAWKESESVVDRAETNYHEIAKELDLENTKFGKFIVISSVDRNLYVFGDTEAEADANWKAEMGDVENAALFQIGNI